ncbi:MAG TPA: HAD-IA family hydrolase [Bacteroidales bacterium]|nr:HAD-IA family hydrolase [Bacteroidales bacterium]
MKFDIKKGIRGLIFDLDGTLADTMPLHFKCWQLACRKYGAEIDNNFLRKYSGSPGWLIADEVIKTHQLGDKVTTEQIIEEKLQLFSDEHHLVKAIEPVAEIARKYYRKLPMAVGTGGHREAVYLTLEITGLKEYFDIIVTANDVKHFKPHPETFLKCAELMNIKPEFIEVFEDSQLGIDAALAAGMIPTDVRSWYDSSW